MSNARYPILWMLALVLSMVFSTMSIYAQSDSELPAQVLAHRLKVRVLPGTDADVLGTVERGMTITITGRETNVGDGGLWVFGAHAESGLSGWLLSDYLDFGAADLAVLPVIEAQGSASAPAQAPAESGVSLAFSGIPAGVVPAVGPRARAIFAHGQALGNRADVFAKVGDSITDNPAFMYPLGWGPVEWGAYGNLAPAYAYFSARAVREGSSFTTISAAARGGWTTYDLLDPARHSIPGLCDRDETPLACEYRLTRPAVALIMIGTNDVVYGVEPAAYRANLERIVQISIDRGVIPVISTLPDNLMLDWAGERVLEYNAVVRAVAAAYGVPLWDYWLALQALPNRGMDWDGLHPSASKATASAAVFSEEGLQAGYTMRNLTGLMALDAVWRTALQ